MLKGRTNIDTHEYLKVDIMGFKDKSLSYLSYQNVGSPGGLHRHARLSNLYIKGKKIKTKSGCLFGSRVKQVESELCASSGGSVTVITF